MAKKMKLCTATPVDTVVDQSMLSWNASSTASTSLLEMLPQPPLPVLCDDVLLDIFAGLNMEELFKVAKCSYRYQALAQSTFARALAGNFQLSNDLPKSITRIEALLRVFGPLVQQFKASFTSTGRRSSIIWQHLDINQLKSLTIEGKTLAYIPPDGAFTQLKELRLFNIVACPVLNRQIVGTHRFPALKTLELEFYDNDDGSYYQYPSLMQRATHNFKTLLRSGGHLERVRLRHMPLHLALTELITFLAQLGKNRTLRELVMVIDIRHSFHFGNIVLTPTILLFSQLRVLDLGGKRVHNLIAMQTMLKDMPHLEYVRFMMNDRVHMSKKGEFLMLLAGSLPPKLKEFVTGSVDRDVWQTFLAAMPNTCMCQHIMKP